MNLLLIEAAAALLAALALAAMAASFAVLVRGLLRSTLLTPKPKKRYLHMIERAKEMIGAEPVSRLYDPDERSPLEKRERE